MKPTNLVLNEVNKMIEDNIILQHNGFRYDFVDEINPLYSNGTFRSRYNSIGFVIHDLAHAVQLVFNNKKHKLLLDNFGLKWAFGNQTTKQRSAMRNTENEVFAIQIRLYQMLRPYTRKMDRFELWKDLAEGSTYDKATVLEEFYNKHSDVQILDALHEVFEYIDYNFNHSNTYLSR